MTSEELMAECADLPHPEWFYALCQEVADEAASRESCQVFGLTVDECFDAITFTPYVVMEMAKSNKEIFEWLVLQAEAWAGIAHITRGGAGVTHTRH